MTNAIDFLTEVKDFAASMASRGDYAETTARLRVTATKQLASVLEPGELDSAEAFHEALPDLARRYAVKNPDKKVETVKTYEGRARGLFEDFFQWKADPTGFKGRTRKTSDEKKTKTNSKKSSETAPPVSASSKLRDFPLPNGRGFSFKAPDDMTRDEVFRVACHLLTMAKDFHPSDFQRFSTAQPSSSTSVEPYSE